MFLIVLHGSAERILTVADDCDLATLKAAVAAEFGLPETEVQLEYAESTLQPGLLSAQAVSDGAQIEVRRRAFSIHDLPPNATPEQLVQYSVDHPQLLRQVDPELSALLASRDLPGVRRLLMSRNLNRFKATFETERELARLSADPDNPENQQKIQEMIQQERINEAHSFAMENNPEAFASVFMLYINLTINDYPLKAFVDSGAQMTIMSRDCAERCGILRLMDTRYAGIASGVGTGRILGKIHMVQMKLGQSFFPVSITVLESNKMEFLFGLDTLKRYRCCIDLSKNVLRMLDGIQGVEEIPFLGEADIPKGNLADDDDGEPSKVAGSSAASSATAPVPASAGPSTSSATASAGVGAGGGVIDSLMQMTGCPREQVILALQQSDNDADLAAALLFASK